MKLMCLEVRLCNMECNFFSQQDVINVFKKSKVGKSSGPDKIGGCLLKTCADQLGLLLLLLAFNTIQPHVLIKKLISEFKLELKIVG